MPLKLFRMYLRYDSFFFYDCFILYDDPAVLCTTTWLTFVKYSTILEPVPKDS